VSKPKKVRHAKRKKTSKPAIALPQEDFDAAALAPTFLEPVAADARARQSMQAPPRDWADAQAGQDRWVPERDREGNEPPDS